MLRIPQSWFPILGLLFLIGLNACVEEQDITDTQVEFEKPKPGEIVLLQGTVRDTTERGIADASLRVQLDGFVKDITTDQNGFFEVEIPVLAEQALLVAAKPQYFRSIQRLNFSSYQIEKDIYLVDEQSVQTVDLEVDNNNLLQITGCLVDQFDVPAADVFVNGQSAYDDDEKVSYSTKSDESGCFEFFVEKEAFEWHALLAGSFLGTCFDQFFDFRLAQDPPPADDVFDWGAVRFPISRSREAVSQAVVDPCSTSDYVNHIFQAGNINNLFQEIIPPGQILDICDTSTVDLWFYSGAMSTDKRAFDGGFLWLNELSNQQDYSLCMPAEEFVEIRFQTDTVLLLAPNISIEGRTIQASDDTGSIEFSLAGSFGVTSGRTDSQGNNIIVSSKTSRVGKLEKRGPNEELLFELDASFPWYVNLVDGTDRRGVLTARIKWNDGQTELITIRYSL